MWRFIDSGPGEAAHNMALDEAIARVVKRGDAPPTVRIYGWERPSVSIGSFQDITDIDVDYCSTYGIPVVRRPTGGRALLHDDEITYSFSSKNEGLFAGGLLETYRLLSGAFSLFFSRLGLHVEMQAVRQRRGALTGSALCFEATSFGELTHKGRKIIGSAQKRWHDGFLQQGSIPYSMDMRRLHAVVRMGRSGPAPSLRLRGLLPRLDLNATKKYLVASFEEHFGVTLEEAVPGSQELELAHQLSLEKYQDRVWTLRRAVKAGSNNSNGNSPQALQGSHNTEGHK